jgi:hypothetical protein
VSRIAKSERRTTDGPRTDRSTEIALRVNDQEHQLPVDTRNVTAFAYGNPL